MVDFPLMPPRRWAAAAIAAAALVAAAIGGGYLLGHAHAKPAPFAASRVVPMAGQGSLAVLRIGKADKAGNWPMELLVSGLPTQKDPRAYYELWLSRHGKPVAPCGSFRVSSQSTTVRLSVPYRFSRFDGWVVTAQPANDRSIGQVVLKT